ncbi:MAG: adenylate kinase [Bacilli bacterium]
MNKTIILITGATHTGKTWFAQKMLEKFHYPTFSLDLLKMGLIRSHNTHLTPNDDDKMTDYLWPIVKEMVKTAIENDQKLIVEGCYIPFNWKQDFTKEELEQIDYYCFIMSEQYIENHFDEIKANASIIEKRINDAYCTKEYILTENKKVLENCQKIKNHYLLIDHSFDEIFAHIDKDNAFD